MSTVASGLRSVGHLEDGRTTELKSWNDELMARSMLEPAPRASNSARHGFGLPGCGERQVDAIDGFAEEFTALSVPYSPLLARGNRHI